MVSIRILQSDRREIRAGIRHPLRLRRERNPPYPDAGARRRRGDAVADGGAYSVFANGGYKINPYLITKVTDADGKILSQVKPDKAGDPANRIIDERNAFMMDSMLKDVVRYGTAVKALALKRTDIAGKTGTTNDSFDAWFAGYQPKIVGIAWVGFDQPQKPGQPRDRRRAGAADLDRLHAKNLEGRAERRPDQSRKASYKRAAITTTRKILPALACARWDWRTKCR